MCGVGGWVDGVRLKQTPPVELAYDRQRGVERLIRTGSNQSRRSPTGAVRLCNLLRSKCVQDADLSEIEEEKLDQMIIFEGKTIANASCCHAYFPQCFSLQDRCI